MTLQEFVNISLGAILIENFILVKFLGICPFLGSTKKMNTALTMSFAVTFVMTLSSAAAWAVSEYLLVPFDILYMSTAAYVLLIAVLVQFVELFLKKTMPVLFDSLGIYLPLITTNCAVLGVIVINGNNKSAFLPSVTYAFMAGIGFTLAMCLFASVRERLEFSNIPKAFEGFPIALVTAGLIAMTFMGFSGLSFY